MPSRKLKEFLDRHKIKYEVITHMQAYTTQEIAAAAHIPGKRLAKTVIVKVDGIMAMTVLPASYRVDFQLLKKATGAILLSLTLIILAPWSVASDSPSFTVNRLGAAFKLR